MVDSKTEKITLNGFDYTGNIRIPYLAFPYVKKVSIPTGRTGNNVLAVDNGESADLLQVDWSYRDARC